MQSRGEHRAEEATQCALPEPGTLLRAIDWIRLTHALGPAADVPAALGRLLDDDLAVRASALDHLEKFLHHQNTIYPATVPAALYLAAILPDPRTCAVGVHRRGDWPRPQRAVLIDWLGEMADDVRDDVLAIRRRHGFADYPPIDDLRFHRGALSRAVAAFLDDPDPATREAAVITTALLLDIPALVPGRGDLGPRVRRVASETTSRYHGMRAEDCLRVWGEAPAPRFAPAVHDWPAVDEWAGGYRDEPPF